MTANWIVISTQSLPSDGHFDERAWMQTITTMRRAG
jgi:hypothetical protein